MAALATITDLEALRGRTLTGNTARVARIERLLEMVSAVVRTYCDQAFELVEEDTVELWPDEANRYRLPERPVVELHSVTDGIGGVHLPAAVRADRDGFLVGVGPIYGRRQPFYASAPITAVYTHGYAEIPADIVLVVCSAAMRALVNPTGLTQRSVGDYSESFRAEDGTTVTLVGAELRQLRTYRWEAA